MAVVGRYLLSASIFDDLAKIGKGAGGEIQLTDGIARLMQREAVYAFEFEGKRYDCGNKLGYLQATVEYGLKHPSLGAEFAAYLKELVREAVSSSHRAGRSVRAAPLLMALIAGARVRAAARIAPVARRGCRENSRSAGRPCGCAATLVPRIALAPALRHLEHGRLEGRNSALAAPARCRAASRFHRSRPARSPRPAAPARPVRPMRCT